MGLSNQKEKDRFSNIVQLSPSHLLTPPLLSSTVSLTITGLCHSDFEFRQMSASHLFILTASFTCRVSGSLKDFTTFILYATSKLPLWWRTACFHRGESSCLPWYLARCPNHRKQSCINILIRWLQTIIIHFRYSEFGKGRQAAYYISLLYWGIVLCGCLLWSYEQVDNWIWLCTRQV